MIRKISVQDVVSKHSTKERLDHEEAAHGKHNDEERDFLIERLTRKRAGTPVHKAPVHAAPKKRSSGSGHKKWIWMSVPLVIAILLVVILQFFAGATITITPKKATVPVDTTLIASIDNTISSSTVSSSSTLMYQIITLNASDMETVLATSTVPTKPVKATGQIIVYNNYSTAPQTLVANTRFETPSGLIYRITGTVSVPGMTTVSGKSVAGSLTVKVVADQVGSKYSIDLTDFTIPGFKTDAVRYAKLYARSKTVMAGGSDGNSFGVSPSDRQATQTLIDNRLKESLLKQVQAQKTANSIIFGDATKISFQHLPDTAGADSQHAVIHEQGTISAVAFDKQILGKVLLSDAITKVGGSAEIHGLENLKFTPAVPSSSTLWQAKPFTFSLTGSVDVIGAVDSVKLLQDVLGVSRSNLPNVFAKYPTIDKVNTEIKPLWQSSVPGDPTKVKIEIVK